MMQSSQRNNSIISILTGSFDLNVKTLPDAQSLMRMDGIDTAKYAYEFEMLGFALNSKEYVTTPSAQMLNRMYPGIKILGSISLDYPVTTAGIHATKNAASLGTKIVRIHQNLDSTLIANLAETEKFISTIKNLDILLISANLSIDDSTFIFNLAKDSEINKMMAYYPINSTSINDLKHITSLGVYIELALKDLMPLSPTITIGTMCKTIRDIGADHCVATTRFGDIGLPVPAEGMRMLIAFFLEKGLSEDEITKLVKSNPNKLIS